MYRFLYSPVVGLWLWGLMVLALLANAVFQPSALVRAVFGVLMVMATIKFADDYRLWRDRWASQ